MKELRILVIEPGEKPHIEIVTDELETWQDIVDGYIEIIYPFDDNAVLVCNEEGKILGLEANRRVNNDTIAGTFAIVGDDGYGEFESLTNEQVNKYMALFDKIPENLTYGTPPFFEFFGW